MQKLTENFAFRNIRTSETDKAVVIEQICFPPNEACSEKNMKDQIKSAPLPKIGSFKSIDIPMHV